MLSQNVMVSIVDIRILCIFLLETEHMWHVWQMFKKLICVCETWCEFHQPSVSLLGYILDAQAVNLAENQEKVMDL